MTTTDRRDADDATFEAELARLDRLPVADEDTVERVARAMWNSRFAVRAGVDPAWEHVAQTQQDLVRVMARAAIAALKPAPGTAVPSCACGGPCEHDGSLAEALREQQRLHQEEPDVFPPPPALCPDCESPFHGRPCPRAPAPGTDSSAVIRTEDDVRKTDGTDSSGQADQRPSATRRYVVGTYCPRGNGHFDLIASERYDGSCGSKGWPLIIEVEDGDDTSQLPKGYFEVDD